MDLPVLKKRCILGKKVEISRNLLYPKGDFLDNSVGVEYNFTMCLRDG